MRFALRSAVPCRSDIGTWRCVYVLYRSELPGPVQRTLQKMGMQVEGSLAGSEC